MRGGGKGGGGDGGAAAAAAPAGRGMIMGADYECVKTFEGHSGLVQSVAWNGKLLASGSRDKTIRTNQNVKFVQQHGLLLQQRNQVNQLYVPPQQQQIFYFCQLLEVQE